MTITKRRFSPAQAPVSHQDGFGLISRSCQPPDGDVRDAVAARDGRSRYRRLAIWNGAGSGRAQSTLVQPFGSVGAVRFSMAQSPLSHGTAIAAPVLITSAKAADNRSRFMFITRCSFRDPVAWGSRWPYASKLTVTCYVRRQILLQARHVPICTGRIAWLHLVQSGLDAWTLTTRCRQYTSKFFHLSVVLTSADDTFLHILVVVGARVRVLVQRPSFFRRSPEALARTLDRLMQRIEVARLPMFRDAYRAAE